ncbi:MAG: zf-HC2 domain-containing protein [Kofleriaceae bacterium]
MSQVCDSIETLSMSYLDDELAPEEKRELELHLLECASCRAHLAEERQEVELLRERLATPPASELVRARAMRLLDREDAQVSRALLRERVARWALPGTSFVAAAAALLVFAFARTPSAPSAQRSFGGVVASHPTAALEVTGDETQPWLQRQIAGTVAPRFDGIKLLGGVPLIVAGRRVAKLQYEVRTTGAQRFRFEANLFKALDSDQEFGRPVQVGDHVLYVATINDLPTIAYRDARGIQYLFISRDLSASSLLDVLAQSNLLNAAR